MQIVRHRSFLESLCAISPNISWLSAVVPKLLKEMGSDKAEIADGTLKDLAIQVNQLVGESLDLDTQVVEVESGTILIVNGDQLETIEGPAVPLIADDRNLKNLRIIEERLRRALAETIITRAEAEGILPEEDGVGEDGGMVIDQQILDALNQTNKPKSDCDFCSEVAAKAGLPCTCPH